jgi:hypothetical protein
MLKSVAGKVVLWLYITGYWFYLLFAALMAWPGLPLMAWVNYVLFQALYAVFWPILVTLELISFRW